MSTLEDSHKSMFGCSKELVEAEFAHLEGFSSSTGMVIMSCLSDVQEMLERGLKEEARQALNRVKFYITTKPELMKRMEE
jgi:hypothetical protein